MNIGSNYSDARMYKGIRHYDKVPLFGEDLNEATDIQSNKITRVVKTLLDSGVLNNVNPVILSSGITFQEPLALNIDGDICIIKNSDTIPMIGHTSLELGIGYIVGWYQHIISSTTMREYGGVNNEELENTLTKNEFSIQSTSRYQFRWDVYVSNTELHTGSKITIPARDSDGNTLNDITYDLTINNQSGNLLVADKPGDMDYAIDNIYILPIVRFIGSSGTITSAELLSKVAVSFNYKLEDIYFEDIATSDISTPSDITMDMNILGLSDTDIIRITYEGIELSQDTDYIIDYANNRITLLGFTRRIGEKLKVNITRLVEY